MKLEDSDDIEDFLTFERLAAGKARSAFVAMDPEHTQDYDRLKEAVLKKYDVSRHSNHQRENAIRRWWQRKQSWSTYMSQHIRVQEPIILLD